MRLHDVAEKLNLTEVVATSLNREQHVTSGYVSDLLSDVMGFAVEGAIWVTIQAHPNIVAVAVLAELSGIIIAGGIKPSFETINRAKDQGVAIYTCEEDAFTIVGKLYALGLEGARKARS